MDYLFLLLMDVDRIQKINTLALDLMRQGLAYDKEEAIKQAEEILAKEDCSVLKEAVDEAKELNLDEEKSSELGLGQIKEILEKNTIFVVKKMKEIQKQIEGLNNAVGVLKKEVDGVKYTVSNMPLKEAVRVEPQQKLGLGENQVENKSSQENSSSGNLDSAAVSIEKFFYSGSNKRD
jgi:seryl-tRNA synthetase